MKQLKQFYVFDPEDVLINHFETYKEAKEFSENKKHAHIHYLNEYDSFSMLFLDAYYTNEYKGLEPMHYILTCKNYFMRITNPLKIIKRIDRNGLSKYSHNSESIALYTIKDSYNPYNLLTFKNLKEIEDFHPIFKKQYTGKELERINKKKELFTKHLNKKYNGFNNSEDINTIYELYNSKQLPQYQMKIIESFKDLFDVILKSR